MENSTFNVAYGLRNQEGWFSVIDLVSKLEQEDNNVLCIKAYQAMTQKIVFKIDLLMDSFIKKNSLEGFSVEFEAYEHFVELCNNKKGFATS